MKRFLFVVAVAACHSATTSADTGVASTTPAASAPTPTVSAVLTTPPVADASLAATDARDATDATARTCGDLTPDEKAALETCALSRFGAALGYRGAFTARIEMSGTSLPRVRSEADTEPNKFRTAVRGDACDRAAVLLSPRLPCTWDVHGPAPTWTLTAVSAP